MNTSAPTLHHSNTPSLRSPRYALRRGLGLWLLTFAGQESVFKHEQGTLYVSYLLHNPPPEPIHGLALALRVKANGAACNGATEIAHPDTGEMIIVQNDAHLTERHLRLDDAEATYKLRRTLHQLDGMMADRNEREAVKAELHDEIESIEQFQRKHMRRVEDDAQKAVRAVRRAIYRLHAHVAVATDPVLASFADHIQKFIMVPSARFAARPNTRARTGLAGCFTYEPPAMVTWHQ